MQHRRKGPGPLERRPEPHSSHAAAPAPPTVDRQPPKAAGRRLAAHKRPLLGGEAGLHSGGRWGRDGRRAGNSWCRRRWAGARQAPGAAPKAASGHRSTAAARQPLEGGPGTPAASVSTPDQLTATGPAPHGPARLSACGAQPSKPRGPCRAHRCCPCRRSRHRKAAQPPAPPPAAASRPPPDGSSSRPAVRRHALPVHRRRVPGAVPAPGVWRAAQLHEQGDRSAGGRAQRAAGGAHRWVPAAVRRCRLRRLG